MWFALIPKPRLFQKVMNINDEFWSKSAFFKRRKKYSNELLKHTLFFDDQSDPDPKQTKGCLKIYKF